MPSPNADHNGLCVGAKGEWDHRGHGTCLQGLDIESGIWTARASCVSA